MEIKKIVCLGAGCVGCASMAVLAENCPEFQVTLVDNDAKKVEAWTSFNLPIFEPKLDKILQNVLNKNLFITTDLANSVSDADIIFIAVNTPTKILGEGAGRATLVNHIEHVAREIGKYAKNPSTIVVEKSTVPVGVSRSIKSVLNANSEHGVNFRILANPEFMSEGSAVDNLRNPDRILIGHDDNDECRQAANILKKIYQKWVSEERILLTDCWSAELAKLTMNAFLAQRITSINAISAICEKTGANVTEVSHAVGTDSRIGPKFMRASVGFGGSAFAKDLLQLVYIAESLHLAKVASYWESVITMNLYQINRFTSNIVRTLFGTLMNKIIAVFGFAFKYHTNDTRGSPAIRVCDMLLEEGAIIHIYDQKTSKEQIFSDLQTFNPDRSIEVFDRNVKVYNDDEYESTKNAHALVILNDSPEFCSLDFKRIYDSMMKPAFLFDGRNLLDREKLRDIGFITQGIGVVPDNVDNEF